MFISTSIVVNPQDAVPSAGRAAWLTQLGPVSPDAVVRVTLPAETWETCGVAITPAATVEPTSAQVVALVAAILAFITETGAVPASLPLNRAVAALGG